jgi:hypothetical protein
VCAERGCGKAFALSGAFTNHFRTVRMR